MPLLSHAPVSEAQIAATRSFIGGAPTLPRGLAWPTNGRTGADLTFFFQVKMPEDGPWAGAVICVFLDITAYEDDELIPALPANLRNTNLTRDFFTGYERFFRLIVLEDAGLEPRADAPAWVAHHPLTFGAMEDDGILFGRIGEAPSWELEDEAPRTFEGDPAAVAFLFQTALDYEFETVAGAPRQLKPDYTGAGGSTPSGSPRYDLFATNACYYFGIEMEGQRQVYVLPQS